MLLAIHPLAGAGLGNQEVGARLVEYWLIDVQSGNGQGWYRSVDEALRAVVDEIQANGGQPIEELGLIAIGGSEGGREIGRGQALGELALQRYPLAGSTR